jgi:3-hydroxyacyl-CoA dehydrogenase
MNAAPYDIKKIAVIGSGVMGSGIAAQIANSGHEVLLFDIVPQDAQDRAIIAKNAIEKMHDTAPAPLMLPEFAGRITPLNLEDDLPRLGECDWIIEVVLEKLEVKHETYKKIIAHKKDGAIISSNTSTIPLAQLSQGFDDDFKSHFLITHFFNPPRYLRLLELVTSADTKPEVTKVISDFCDKNLGKGIVPCHDTPGFIANRIGTFWMQTGLNIAIKNNVAIDIADSVMGAPLGIPKTALFGLIDLVGVDLLPKLADSLKTNLDKEDRFQKIHKDHALIQQMIEAGFTGRKGKGGFSRMIKGQDGSRTLMVLDLQAATQNGFNPEGSFRPAQKPDLPSLAEAKKGLKAFLSCDDEGANFAREVMVETLIYTASLVPEIADEITAVDEAMRLGYAWKYGPFEMIDMLGADWLIKEGKARGLDTPELLQKAADADGFYKEESHQTYFLSSFGKYAPLTRPDGVLKLSDIKRGAQPLYKADSAALWDIGQGVVALEFTAKMNAIDFTVFDCVHKAIDIIKDSVDFKALVLYNENGFFSAGANLKMALQAFEEGDEDFIPKLVAAGHKAMMALKFAPFPVIGAPTGLALGGGCEFLLHCDAVQAHAETYCGLVETSVGLIPGWGGCKEMLLRFHEDGIPNAHDGSPMGGTMAAFHLIRRATRAANAFDAKRLGYLHDKDGITMNLDRLLYDARAKALELAKDYEPKQSEATIKLAGASAFASMEIQLMDGHEDGNVTDYDFVIGKSLARVLSGGINADKEHNLSEHDILKLEYEEFCALVKNQGTKDRIAHMLNTGKPLRN